MGVKERYEEKRKRNQEDTNIQSGNENYIGVAERYKIRTSYDDLNKAYEDAISKIDAINNSPSALKKQRESSIGWLNDTNTTSDRVKARQDYYKENENKISDLNKELSDMLLSSYTVDDFGNAIAPALTSKEYKDKKNQLNALKNTNLQYDRTQGKTDRYFDIVNTADFAEKSSVRDYEGDILGDYLAMENPKSAPDFVYHNYDEYVATEGNTKYWNKLNENEIGIYYYLYHDDPKAARKYLEDMEVELGRRYNEDMIEEINPNLGLDLASVPLNVFGGITAATDDAMNIITGKEINPYSIGHSMQNTASAIRTKRSEQINETFGSGSFAGMTWGDVYQSIMSGADSLLGGFALGESYTYLMGLSAASSEAKDLYEQGATTGQIIAGATLSGVAEALFEKVSLDKMLNAKNPKNAWDVVYNFISQAFVEGSEEVNTEIANTITNAIVMAQNSDWEQYIKQYTDQGYTRAEASSMAIFKDIAPELVKSFMGGAISGGLMAAGSSTIGAVNYNTEALKQGQNIISNANVENLLDKAGTQDYNTRAISKYAEKVSSDTAKEGKSYEKNVGKLYYEMQDANAKSYEKSKINAAENLVKDYIKDKAFTNNREKLASALVREYLEQDLSVSDKNALKSADNSLKAQVKSMLDENLVKETKRNVANTLTRSDVLVSYTQAEDKLAKDALNKVAENKENVSPIKNVASVSDDGVVTYNLQNGKTATSNDILYENNDQAILYETALQNGFDAETTNEYISGFENSGLESYQYAKAMSEAITYGKYNYAMDKIDNISFYQMLSEPQKKWAWELGNKFANTLTYARQSQTDALKGMKAVKKGKMTFLDVDSKSLNDFQKEQINAISATLSMDASPNVYFYASQKVDGKMVVPKKILNAIGAKEGASPNGAYVSKTGDIFIDVNAGNNGDGVILWTYAHELTHFVRQWSPAKFKTFADFIVKNYMDKGVDVDALVQEKMNSLGLGYDAAYEEVIADSMQPMFTDANLAEKLAELKQKDKSLWAKLKQFFQDLSRRIHKAYKGLKPETKEARLMLSLGNKIDDVANMFAAALVDAGDAYAKSSNSNSSVSKYSDRDTFNELFTESNGKLSVNVADVSTEDWNVIAKAVKKAGYTDVTSGKIAKEVFSRYTKNGTYTFNEEQSNAIRTMYGATQESVSANPQRAKAAKKYFGTTNDFREAGYLLQDGSMLDFSGKKFGGPRGMRTMDHREIAPIFNDGEVNDNDGTSAYMNTFISEGNIRLMETQGVTIGELEPTSAQYSLLKKFIDHVLREEDYFYLDLSNNAGDTIESRDYNENDSASKIISDIRAFYKNGELPYRSELNQFRYSNRDSEGNALSKGQMDYFKNSKALDDNGNLQVVYHGTRNPNFTVFNRSTNFYTSSKAVANSYNPNNEKLYEGYVNIENPLVVDADGSKWSKIPINKELADFIRNYGGSVFTEGGKLRSTPADIASAVLDAIDDGEVNYDGIIIKNVDDTGSYYKGKVANLGTDYITFNSNQFKNIDNANPTSNADVRYSPRDSKGNVIVDDFTFDELNTTLQSIYEGKYEGNNFTFPILQHTPQVILDYCDSQDRSFVMRSDKAYNAMQSKTSRQHSLGVDGLEKAILKLFTPSYIIYEGDGDNAGHYVAIVDINNNGIESVVAFEIDNYRDSKNAINNENGRYNVLITSFTPSEYSDYIDRLFENEKNYVVYEDDGSEKYKAPDFVALSETLSGRNAGASFADTLSQPTSDVKNSDRDSSEYLKLAKNSDRDSSGKQLSKGQLEFFKDSKARDENGNLLVLYHGTENSFTTFKEGSAIGWGKGIYFTDNKDNAKEFGSNIVEGYANIVNPFDARYVNIADIEDEAIKTEAYKKLDKKIYKDLYADDYDSYEAYQADTKGIDWNTVYEEHVDTFNAALRELGFDGIIAKDSNDIEGLEVVAFNSNQIKSTTNLNPTENEDIRYSERDYKRAEELEKVNNFLEKENAKLKEDLSDVKELLKLQGKVTSGTLVKRSSVETLARRFKKQFNANGNSLELANLLEDAYNTMQAKDVDYADVEEKLGKAVDWINENKVEEQRPLSEEANRALRYLKGQKVALTQSQLAEVKKRYESYDNFRKQLSGTGLVISSNAEQTLDQLWQEASSEDMFAEWFDSSIKEGDMPLALVDIVSSLKESYDESDYFFGKEELTDQGIFNELYNGFWDASTLYTVADKNQKKINALKLAHQQRMTALRQARDAKIAEIRKANQEEKAALRNEYKERAEKERKALIDRYNERINNSRERSERTALRNKIIKRTNEIVQLLKQKNGKKTVVPVELEEATVNALEIVDMDTVSADRRLNGWVDDKGKYHKGINQKLAEAKTPYEKAKYEKAKRTVESQGVSMKAKLEALRDLYSSIKASTNQMLQQSFDADVMDMIEEVRKDVGNTKLHDMSLEQLQEVYSMYSIVLSTIRDYNKMFKLNKKLNAEETSLKVIEEAKSTDPATAKLFAQKFKSVGLKDFKPYYAFKYTGSETFMDLFKNLRAGEDVAAVDIQEAKDVFNESADKYGYDSWDLSKTREFTSVDNKKFKLTVGEIMSLYAYSKRNQAYDHLTKGGIVLQDKLKKGIRPAEIRNGAYLPSWGIIQKAINTLTPEQKAFVDDMQRYLSTDLSAKGNEVSRELYDIELFKEKNYFPLKSASQFLTSSAEPTGDRKIKNSGFTKAVTPMANNPIILQDFMNVWSNHVNEMAMYHAFTLPLEDMQRVLNYHNNMEGLSTRMAIGEAASSYVQRMLVDINGGLKVNPDENTIQRLAGKFRKNAVFASASVVVQQPSAIARAFAVVEPKYFAEKLDIKNHGNDWNEVKKYAPVAIIKDMGYFDTNMGQTTTDYITNRTPVGAKNKIAEFFSLTDSKYRDEILSKAPGLADELTWTQIWKACKNKVRSEQGLEGENLLKEAGKLFTDVIVQTQVYDSTLSRSQYMRNKDFLWKSITAFMAEPTTTFNMLADAVIEAKRTGNTKQAQRVFSSVLASTILNAVLVSFVYAARKDDEDKTYLEKYLASFTNNFLDNASVFNMIPLGKDLVSMLQGYNVERADLSLFSDLISAYKKLRSDNVSAWKKIEDFGGTLAAFLGVPLKNVMRDLRSVYNVVNDFTSNNTTSFEGVKEAVVEEITGKSEVAQHKNDIQKAVKKNDYSKIKKYADSYKQMYIDKGKTADEARSSVQSALTSIYKPLFLKAYQEKNEAEMARLRKALKATGIYKDVIETTQSWIKSLAK